MSKDPEATGLDLIVDEIEAASSDKPEIEVVEAPVEEPTAIVKRTADDLADRRKQAWALRQRGLTYRQIGEELSVAPATAKRDVDIALKTERTKFETYNREEHIAGTIAIYDDVIREGYAVLKGADKETKLKALTLIRQTTQAREKSLQSTGVVRKENQVQETVQISLISKFDEKDVGRMASALLASQLNLHLAAPTLDIDDAEIVEDEDDMGEETE